MVVASVGPYLVTGDVTWHANGGGGTFGAAQTVASGLSGARTLAVADFTNDGVLDIAVAEYGAAIIVLIVGTGGGTFAAPITVSTTATGVYTLVAADLNGDALIDLVSAEYVCASCLCVCAATAVFLYRPWGACDKRKIHVRLECATC